MSSEIIASSFLTRSSSVVFDDFKVKVQPTHLGASHLFNKVTSEFRLPKIIDWRLCSNHPLLTIGFQNVVIDASSLSPYAICRTDSLLITCALYDMSSRRIHPDLQRLCQNHIRVLSESLISRDKSKFSLTNILFGTTVFHSSLCCKKSILIPAKSAVNVPTSILPHGPTRLKLESASYKALGSLFKKKMVKDSEKYPVIHTETNLLPRVMHGRYKFQDPREHRAKRFLHFLEKQNYEVPAIDISFGYDTPFIQSRISDITLSRSLMSEEAFQRSAQTDTNDPPRDVSDVPDITSPMENVVPKIRSNRPVTALSRHCDAIIRDKRRPVSATVLSMKLPLHHPLSASYHESTVVLSPKMGTRIHHRSRINANITKARPGSSTLRQHRDKAAFIG